MIDRNGCEGKVRNHLIDRWNRFRQSVINTDNLEFFIQIGSIHGMVRVVSCVCKFVCLSVCVCVCVCSCSKAKLLELSTPQSMANPWHALTIRSEGQRAMIWGYQVKIVCF